MANQVRRLYSSFHPDSYLLDVTLDPKNMSFKAKVVIDGAKVGRPSKRLTFHQKNLKVISAKVTNISQEGNHELKIERINYHKSFDELRLHFDHNVYAGRYLIEIEYTGVINTQLQGIYASTFKDKSKKKTIICTQFQSHYARQALPCIDEPEAKAIFNLTLRTPPDLSSSISNSDPQTQEKKDGLLVTKFSSTPKMSCYLLAFIAGELKYLEKRTKNNVRVRTYATAANVKFTDFALDCAVRTLDFYDEYFAIPYPLPKCDLVALPDFSAAAMENWGCVTFREQCLVVDPKNTSLDLKQFVATVIAHELTHQWFGNLVTMRWWNDLWLNESFASWMSYLAVDHLFPDWKVWTQFIIDEQGLGLRQDALEYTHPIEVKINNPEEIRTVFDAISYEKGASVITMLHDYLGADIFRDGIRLYLSENQFANTDTSDLWQALESVSKKNVSQFMNHWTAKSGYPLLKAVYQENGLHLEQHRFYLNPMAKQDNSIWPIPLFSELNLGRNDPFTHRSINLTLQSPPSRFILNNGRRGFYRVIYDQKTLSNALSEGLVEQLADVDRLGLISDAWEAAKAGYLPTLNVLNMLEYYSDETSPVVWEVIAGGLGSIRMAMDDERLRQSMKPFVRRIVKPELDRLGLEAKNDDTHFDKLLRPTILGMAAVADEPSVVKALKELFYGGSLESIDPDIRGVVYTSIARHGTELDFDEFVKMYKSTSSPEEKLKLTAAITNFKQPKLITKALGLINSPDVRSQDITYWISYSLTNHYSRDNTWKWIKNNWQWIEDTLGEDLHFYLMPFYVARCYSSLEFLSEFEDFFNSHMSAGFERPLRQSIETIQWQADWKRRDLENIRQFFSNS